MKNQQIPTLDELEVVLNLWLYADEEGYILRIAGKAYVLGGSDEEKLALLRQLSGTDFISAPWKKVPEQFSITNADGKVMHGVAHASMMSDPFTQGQLFRSLMDEIDEQLPEQIRSINGGYQSFRLKVPEDALCVTTTVTEYEDGRLVPVLS